MKLKPYLKNSANPALLFNLSLILLLFSSCSANIEPTYKEKDIPFHIQKICKEEYGLNVTTRLVGSTLWVYAALPRIIDKDYAVTKDKIFDDQMNDKLRKIMTSIGRVLVSSDRAPEFYCLVISDTQERGLDYTLIGSVMDMKKSYAGFIPWAETNNRYVRKLENAPLALGDSKGEHVRPYDISLPEFITLQISQRIADRFREADLKYLYQVNSIDIQFTPTTLIINADIIPQELRLGSMENNDLTKQSLRIVALVTRAYDFRDYINVEINDIKNGRRKIFNRTAVEAVRE